MNDVSKNFDFSLIAEHVPNLENIGIEFFFHDIYTGRNGVNTEAIYS